MYNSIIQNTCSTPTKKLTDYLSSEFEIESKFGKLWIHLPSIIDSHKSKVATVFTNFIEP
jgi:hypothetical protein